MTDSTQLDYSTFIATLQRLSLNTKEWLTPQEVCEMYGIAPTFLENLRKGREVPYVKTGSSFLFFHDDIKAYFARIKRLSKVEVEKQANKYLLKKRN